jgi:hypothetical protein
LRSVASKKPQPPWGDAAVGSPNHVLGSMPLLLPLPLPLPLLLLLLLVLCAVGRPRGTNAGPRSHARMSAASQAPTFTCPER